MTLQWLAPTTTCITLALVGCMHESDALDATTSSLAATDVIDLQPNQDFSSWIEASAECAPPNRSTPSDLGCPLLLAGTGKGRADLAAFPSEASAEDAEFPAECLVRCAVREGDWQLLDPAAPDNGIVPADSCAKLATYPSTKQQIRAGLKELKDELVNDAVQHTGVFATIRYAPRQPEGYPNVPTRASVAAAEKACKAIDVAPLCRGVVQIPVRIPALGCLSGDGSGSATCSYSSDTTPCASDDGCPAGFTCSFDESTHPVGHPGCGVCAEF